MNKRLSLLSLKIELKRLLSLREDLWEISERSIDYSPYVQNQIDILDASDEILEKEIENKKEIREKYPRRGRSDHKVDEKGWQILSTDDLKLAPESQSIYMGNQESSNGLYLILALLLLPLMILPMPLAFLSYGLLSWLWLGSWTMLNIFLVCTTAYLYSSGNIFLGALMLFMIPVIFFIKHGKDIGSPSLSSMEGSARFKYKKRRIAAAIILLFFCLLLSYKPSFVFVMVLIAIPFFAGYFIYAIANNLI